MTTHVLGCATAIAFSVNATTARALHDAGFLPDSLARQVARDLSDPDRTPLVLDWWNAFSEETIVRVAFRAGTDEGTASLFVAAALHALVRAGAERPTNIVADLAERGIAFQRGVQWGRSHPQDGS